MSSNETFGNFWLTIQNTSNRHVSNAFDLLAAFISFPLARAAAAAAVAADFAAAAAGRPHPTPPPLFWGREVPKNKIACSVGDGSVWTCLRRRGRGGLG
jgi:hypothetical protein